MLPNGQHLQLLCLTLTKHHEEHTQRNTLLPVCGHAEFLSMYYKVLLDNNKKLFLEILFYTYECSTCVDVCIIHECNARRSQ